MPAITYSYTAVQCPAIQQGTATLNPTSITPTPTTASILIPGTSGSGSLSLPFNANAVRVDLLGRHGGGAVAVCTGLELSWTAGIIFTVTAGAAMIDGPVVLAQNQTGIALTANATNHVWLSAGGTISVRTNLTAPSSLSVYLGRLVTNSTTVLEIDYSGRMILGGGALWRRTSDAGAPTDTPSSSIRFFAHTTGGVYVWNGISYQGGAIDSYTSKVTGSDTTTGYLSSKIVAGSNIALSVLNPGAAETLSIALSLGAGSVGTTAIADDAITSAKLSDSSTTDSLRAVTTDAIRDGAIVASKLGALSVTAAAIATNTITTNKYAALSVDAAALAADAVTTTKVLNSSITSAKLATDAKTVVTTLSTFNISCPVGDDRIVTVDFSLAGSYSGDYWVRLTHDQSNTKTLLFVTEQRTSNTFYFLVKNAPDATLGTYSTAADIQITARLEGYGFTAGAGGAPTVTVSTINVNSASVGVFTSSSALADESVALCSAAAGSITIVLPTALAHRGKEYCIKKTDATANTVTIDPDGAQTIDGAATVVLSTQYAYKRIISDGANWHTIG